MAGFFEHAGISPNCLELKGMFLTPRILLIRHVSQDASMEAAAMLCITCVHTL